MGHPRRCRSRHGNPETRRSSSWPCHVKDLAPAGECLDEDGWADPGYGTMGWKDLSGRLRKAGVKYFVAEHDKPNDVARFARRARELAATWG